MVNPNRASIVSLVKILIFIEIKFYKILNNISRETLVSSENLNHKKIDKEETLWSPEW
jgi:hypothetical protein